MIIPDNVPTTISEMVQHIVPNNNGPDYIFISTIYIDADGNKIVTSTDQYNNNPSPRITKSSKKKIIAHNTGK